MLKVLVAFLRTLVVLANGAVIFITLIICRRTTPGVITARGVTELPAPAPAPDPADVAGTAGRVCGIPPLGEAPLRLPDIRGVVLGLTVWEGEAGLLLKSGPELLLGALLLGALLLGALLLGALLLGALLLPAVPDPDPDLGPPPVLVPALGQNLTVTVVVKPGHAAHSALAMGQMPAEDAVAARVGGLLR
ncbi:hypothetical protein N7490_011172 [Penicillium lividum]|nr:hypothetical protein N7490_011172 [Penicillium lividum]